MRRIDEIGKDIDRLVAGPTAGRPRAIAVDLGNRRECQLAVVGLLID